MNVSDKNHESKTEEKPLGPADVADHTQQHTRTSQITVLLILVLVVAALVLAAHWPVLSAQALVGDDNQYLTENRLVQKPGWSSAARFLTEVLKPSTVKGYYQPLAMISLMVDYAVAGRPDNLRPFHRTNLCLHVTNTVLIIVLLYMLFGQAWVAAMVGLLFGLHPMTVEPTAWICERKTLLAAFFSLWCLVLYVRYARKGNRTAYGVCLLMYILALMSKPTSTPLPVLLLLLDYWPLDRLNWRRLVEKVPFFVLGGISAVITFISQAGTMGLKLPTEYPSRGVPLLICHDIKFYLDKIFWPVNLSAHYPLPQPFVLSNPAVFAGVVTTCVLVIVLWLSLRHTRALLVGFLFFFLAILPTMQIIGFSDVVAANKFAYLPSVGLLLPLAWLAGGFWKTSIRVHRPRIRQFAVVTVVTILAVGEVSAARTFLSRWKDTETIYRYMLGLTPNKQGMRSGLARALLRRGQIDEALDLFREELAINPEHYKALNNFAGALALKGRIGEAVEYMSKAVELKPDDFKSRYNLGILLSKLGRYEEAIEHAREAVRIRPWDVKAHYNLGVFLSHEGHTDEAIEQYRAALEIDPLCAPARSALNAALARKGAMGPRSQPK